LCATAATLFFVPAVFSLLHKSRKPGEVSGRQRAKEPAHA
jgi:hypothetical protein